MRGPWPFRFGVQFVPHEGMDARIRQRHLGLLGQPGANLVIAGKAVRVMQFFLKSRQGRRGDPLVDGGLGPLIAQGVV